MSTGGYGETRLSVPFSFFAVGRRGLSTSSGPPKTSALVGPRLPEAILIELLVLVAFDFWLDCGVLQFSLADMLILNVLCVDSAIDGHGGGGI